MDRKAELSRTTHGISEDTHPIHSSQVEQSIKAENDPAADVATIIVENLFIFIFVVELASRIRGGGLIYLSSSWGYFDLVVILMAMVDVWILKPLQGQEEGMKGLSVLRTLRLILWCRMTTIPPFLFTSLVLA